MQQPELYIHETCLDLIVKSFFMKSVSIDTLDDRFIISIDRKLISKDKLLQFLDNLRLEFVATQVNFDDSIEEIGEEIKLNWWEENKDRFIPKPEQ